MAAVCDAPALAEAFFGQLQQIAQSTTVQHFARIADENAELRQKKANLENAYRTNLESLSSLQQEVKNGVEKVSSQTAELERLTTEKKEIEAALSAKNKAAADTEKQLQAKDSEIATLKTKLKQEETNRTQLGKQKAEGEKNLNKAREDKGKIEQELAQVRTDLSEKSEKLSRLEKLEIKLHKKPNLDNLRASLQGIFDSLDKLVQTHIGDLGLPVLSTQTDWKDILNHEAFKDVDLPLPPTNSPDAKSMRRAAVLWLCAWALDFYIFQTSHLVNDSNGLSEVLDELADEDSERAVYIRSILLRLQQDKADSQPPRVNLAIDAVSQYTKDLIADASSQAVFDSTLKNIFMKACKLWGFVQSMEPKITASTDGTENDEWTLVSPKMLDQNSNDHSRVNGDTTNKSLKKSNAPKDGATADAIMIILWPAFVITEDGNTSTIVKGYAISDSDLEAARKEESKAQAQRRLNRLNSRNANPRRRASTSQSIEQTNGGQPFLSQGEGSG